MPKGWRVVNLPNSLVDKIDKLVNSKKLAFLSRDEFVREACRFWLKELIESKLVDYHEIS